MILRLARVFALGAAFLALSVLSWRSVVWLAGLLADAALALVGRPPPIPEHAIRCVHGCACTLLVRMPFDCAADVARAHGWGNRDGAWLCPPHEREAFEHDALRRAARKGKVDA